VGEGKAVNRIWETRKRYEVGMSRYWCERDKKEVGKNKVYAECLMKNDGKSICRNLRIDVIPKQRREHGSCKNS
jgi:hypothetical protein